MPSSAKNAAAKKAAPDRDELVANLKALIEDARSLTSDAAESSQEFLGDKAEELQAQIRDVLAKLKEHGEAVKEKGKEGVETVESFVKENPWKSLGIALLAGVLIDRLIRD